jgi:hypothetical protein
MKVAIHRDALAFCFLILLKHLFSDIEVSSLRRISCLCVLKSSLQ